MQYAWQILSLLGFGVLLTSSAHVVVRSVSHISRVIGLTGYTVSFLLLGLCTSAPEMFVAYRSIVEGVPQLSVGNLIGGSILLLSLVMGLSSVVYGKITLEHGMTFGEIVLSSIVIVAPATVLWDGSLTRIEGAFLIGIYIVHAMLLQKETKVLRIAAHTVNHSRSLHGSVAMLFVALFAMAVASYFMVESATALIAHTAIPAFVFGLVLLSLGTNLPEFALAWQAGKSKKKSIAFGDFMGSAAANTPILGVLGVVAPFQASSSERMIFSLVLLLTVTLFFVWALSSRRDITRKEGLGLLLFYGMFVLFEFLGGS